jgi:hypothetical protein
MFHLRARMPNGGDAALEKFVIFHRLNHNGLLASLAHFV